MKTKVTRNKEEKKENLLAAAYSLLSSRDIKDISIADLAEKAGIAKGTFYLFFKDKYELRDALISLESSRILRRAQHALDANDIRGFEDAVIFMINQILRQLEDNPLLLRIIRRNLSWGILHSSIQSAVLKDEDKNGLPERFCRLAKANGYHFENPDAVFFIILEMTSSICYSCMIENVPLPLDQMKPILFDSIRAVLRQGKQKQTLSEI